MLHRFKSSYFVVVTVVALILGPCSFTFAQTAATGSIAGTVSDSSKAPLASAHVLIRNTDTGNERQVTVNEDGMYVAPLLQPGKYDISVTANGFGTVSQKDVGLTVGQ